MSTRRQFLCSSSAAIGCAALAHASSCLADEQTATPWLRKTLKIGMVRAKDASLEQKFAIARQAGFEGIELNTGQIDADEANAAAKATGLTIDGTVGGYHWKIRHTDPDPEIRKQALTRLKSGIAETAAVGAETMLLVPGHGKDGEDDVVYQRAIESIKQALPDAEKYGVSILMENVWNDFCYDHEGGDDQTADRFAKFIDDFDSPLVGTQYDIGNHWKYSDPAAWIRTLGDRIKKLDIKGFSRAEDKFTQITEGDIDWPSVEQALRDIKFTGWLAAEVGGGDLQHLTTVSEQMDSALHCSSRVPVVG